MLAGAGGIRLYPKKQSKLVKQRETRATSVAQGVQGERESSARGLRSGPEMVIQPAQGGATYERNGRLWQGVECVCRVRRSFRLP